MIAGYWLPQIFWAIRILGAVVLLRVISSAGEITIEQTRCNFVCNDGSHRGQADPEFALRMMRGKINRFRCDFRLENWRHRLRFARQTAFDPAELRRVERGHLHHRDLHVAVVV
jgi:hypothetical protein